jgi:hypothetical protein
LSPESDPNSEKGSSSRRTPRDNEDIRGERKLKETKIEKEYDKAKGKEEETDDDSVNGDDDYQRDISELEHPVERDALSSRNEDQRQASSVSNPQTPSRLRTIRPNSSFVGNTNSSARPPPSGASVFFRIFSFSS